jgi:hypothetical protein
MEEIAAIISHRFARAEPRRRVVAYMEGLLSPTLRKSAFALASHADEVGPDGMQRLLRTAKWDADAVRDDLRAYVLRHTGREPGDGILVTAEETFVKKGRHSAGVTWQYSSTLRRMENCQMGLFLGHVSGGTCGLLDRELYLPRPWLRGQQQVIASGIPRQYAYTPKPRLNQRMIARALEAGLAAPWVSVPDRELWDEELRLWLDRRKVPYVLRLNDDDVAALLPRGRTGVGVGAVRAGRPPEVSALPWQTVRLRGSAGARTLWVLTHRPGPCEHPESYLCSGSATTAVAEFIRAVRAQQTTRRCLDVLKRDVGLHEYQVRTVTGWYRHTTLALLAYAFRTFGWEGGRRASVPPRPALTSLD